MIENKVFNANRFFLGGGQNTRSSNLELYRIVCMLMIVAHHYVVNSGLTADDGPLRAAPLAANSIYLYLFGMWGKTGINCFLMITGYFMCTSKITVRKFLKLYLWVVFYGIVINGIFLATGRLEFSPSLLFGSCSSRSETSIVAASHRHLWSGGYSSRSSMCL